MLEGWTDFFVASAGAAAALAGLVVVAVSVNIERILAFDQLPARAGAAVASFVLALVISLLGLADQSHVALGVEVLGFGVIAWLLQGYTTRVSVRSIREHGRPAHEALLQVVRWQLQSLPFVIGGVLIASDHEAGLYFVLVGILAAFVLSMYEVWILLVEILR